VPQSPSSIICTDQGG